MIFFTFQWVLFYSKVIHGITDSEVSIQIKHKVYVGIDVKF